ncbi:MAG: PAS domain S-box protein, partial [Anaerolineae bacterium]|nr:PAS domain S-box protein [Anaerolineae bacterium]
MKPRRAFLSPAARISLIYFLIGAAWIITSDSVLQAVTQGSEAAYALAQTFKGWLYVAASAGVLYLLLKREFDARQRSEQQVMDREAHFRHLFANNPLPMWVNDRDTLAFLDVNEAACQHYGYSRDEFLRMRIIDIRPPEEVPRLLQFIRENNRPLRQSGEWKHRTKDGRIIEVEATAHALNFEDKPAVLVVIRDVTERKRHEAERLENERLRLMLAQEGELNTMRSRFISMVSHEFRRPLTTVTASIELLEHYRARMTDDSAQKHFSRIHEQLGEMKELLDDFLTLMRDEAEQKDFKPAPVDLIDLCRRLTDEVKLSLPQGLTIACVTNCESVVVEGDEKLLRHAIGNLLSNAVKYSPYGGEIRMEMRHTEMLEIHVSDQGMGIPAADQEHIFDPFFRAGNVSELSGTGLGLAI